MTGRLMSFSTRAPAGEVGRRNDLRNVAGGLQVAAQLLGLPFQIGQADEQLAGILDDEVRAASWLRAGR